MREGTAGDRMSASGEPCLVSSGQRAVGASPRSRFRARPPGGDGGEQRRTHLRSLVLEPHLDHADAQPGLRSQRLPHLERHGPSDVAVSRSLGRARCPQSTGRPQAASRVPRQENPITGTSPWSGGERALGQASRPGAGRRVRPELQGWAAPLAPALGPSDGPRIRKPTVR